jgi:Fuc2NAc and GlcNAc transferase
LFELRRFAQTSAIALAILLAAIAALTLVGWIDDHGSMKVSVRLTVHLLCGLAIAFLVNAIAPLPGLLNVAWLVWWAFWTVASINIVNFMDGVDGMVAGQGVVYGTFLSILLPSSPASSFGIILAAASLGFLVWNWAPAKMFMGDVGSGPLGLFFVIGGALAVNGARLALVFLPLFPLFLDALLTLILRYRRGDKLTHAHRSHLYQRLANGGWGHAPVSSIYALAAAVGALVAISVKDASPRKLSGAIFIYLLAVLLGWKVLHARLMESSPKPGRKDLSRSGWT